MKFRNHIAKKDVYDFKINYCNENEIIANIIKHDLRQYFKPPILDVGAGIGDIAYVALEQKKVMLIDVNSISKHDYCCRPEHVRKKCNFFDFYSKQKINTVLISHTLQFIDDDIDKLNEKIAQIDPEYIILVTNDNTGFMAELLHWTRFNTESSNPEVHLDGFPENYNLINTHSFAATLKCPDYKTLARQASYLMLFDLEVVEDMLIAFLKKHLSKPEFIIYQSVETFHKK